MHILYKLGSVDILQLGGQLPLKGAHPQRSGQSKPEATPFTDLQHFSDVRSSTQRIATGSSHHLSLTCSSVLVILSPLGPKLKGNKQQFVWLPFHLPNFKENLAKGLACPSVDLHKVCYISSIRKLMWALPKILSTLRSKVLFCLGRWPDVPTCIFFIP